MSPRRGEKLMVPEAEFTSYYGRPVLKEPVWETPDVPGYLFLGGLAGASSVLAACAQYSGYGELAKVAKAGPARRSAFPPSSWCMTWAVPRASCICSGCSSRPRR